MNWAIYTLKHPITQEVRYVGFTSAPKSRLRAHLNESIREPRTHKHRWIASIVKVGLAPVMEIIESGTGAEWPEAERKWIAFYRNSGARLVNGTVGGEGVVGWGTPEQLSARGRHAQASMTAEQRSAIGRQRAARKTPEERSAAARERQSKISPERRSEIARKRESKFTPEQRSARAKDREARKTPEQKIAESAKWSGAQRSEALKKDYSTYTPEERHKRIERAQQASNARSHEQRSESARKRWEKHHRSALT